jgi:hypothetical protein
MITCIMANGKPTDIRDIGGPLNMTHPSEGDRIDYALANGRRLYRPATAPNIATSHWEDDGMYAVEYVDSVKTQAQLDAEATAAATARAEQEAAFKEMQGELDNAQLILKGLALTILDELNRTTQRLRDFDAAVQAAVSLADLKTRVGALLPIPDRTVAQLKAAVKAKVAGL